MMYSCKLLWNLCVKHSLLFLVSVGSFLHTFRSDKLYFVALYFIISCKTKYMFTEYFSLFCKSCKVVFVESKLPLDVTVLRLLSLWKGFWTQQWRHKAYSSSKSCCLYVLSDIRVPNLSPVFHNHCLIVWTYILFPFPWGAWEAGYYHLFIYLFIIYLYHSSLYTLFVQLICFLYRV